METAKSAHPGEGIAITTVANEELPMAANLRNAMAMEMGEDWDVAHDGWRQRYVEYWSAKQNTDQAQYFFARIGKEVVAMAVVSLVEDYHGYVRGRLSGRVNAVYVGPSYRRQGVGRALMLSAMSWLKDKGCKVVRLNSSDQGKSLYESLGFVRRQEMEYFF